MGLTRLESLSLMIFDSISNDEAIDYFSSMKSRKVLYFDMYEYNQLVENITQNKFLYLILIKLIIITI